MTLFSLQVGGQWLSTIAPYGPATVEFGIHGLDSVSWSMDPDFRHPVLRGMSRVDVYDGGFLIGQANMQEPGSAGEYTARGYWRQTETALAMNPAGSLTTVLDDAVAGAFARGEIVYGLKDSLSTTPWSTSTQSDMTLAQLLDGWSTQAGLRWRLLTAATQIEAVADPTTPTWLVPNAVAGRGLVPAEDEFVTHLVGWYLSGSGTYAPVTVGSAEAAAAFGRRTGTVDLTSKGVISLAEATSVLTGMFLLSGARMGWGEGLELGYGQITTAGGVPATLSQIRAGQMVRLAGTIDTSRADRLPAYTDIVIGTSKYTDGSDTISLTPLGYAPRTLSDVLSVALED